MNYIAADMLQSAVSSTTVDKFVGTSSSSFSSTEATGGNAMDMLCRQAEHDVNMTSSVTATSNTNVAAVVVDDAKKRKFECSEAIDIDQDEDYDDTSNVDAVTLKIIPAAVFGSVGLHTEDNFSDATQSSVVKTKSKAPRLKK